MSTQKEHVRKVTYRVVIFATCTLGIQQLLPRNPRYMPGKHVDEDVCSCQRHYFRTIRTSNHFFDASLGRAIETNLWGLLVLRTIIH